MISIVKKIYWFSFLLTICSFYFFNKDMFLLSEFSEIPIFYVIFTMFIIPQLIAMITCDDKTIDDNVLWLPIFFFIIIYFNLYTGYYNAKEKINFEQIKILKKDIKNNAEIAKEFQKMNIKNKITKEQFATLMRIKKEKEKGELEKKKLLIEKKYEKEVNNLKEEAKKITSS